MYEDYNIIYKEIKSKKISNIEKIDKNAISLPDNLKNFLENSIFDKNFNENMVLNSLEKNSNFYFDINDVLKFKTKDVSVLEFLKIKDVLEYLYENNFTFYCKECGSLCGKLDEELIKNITDRNASLLALGIKIKDESKEKLKKLGINKIIKKEKIFDLKDVSNLEKDYAIFKTTNLSKIKNFLQDLVKLKGEKINFFEISKEKDKITKIFKNDILLKDDIFICPKCKKSFKKEDLENCLFDITFKELIKKELKDLKKILKKEKQLSPYTNEIIKRIDNLDKFNIDNLNGDAKIEDLKFFVFLKILLSFLCFESSNFDTLILKDIFDFINEKEKEEILNLLDKNLKSFIILENKNNKNKTINFFKIKEYTNKNQIKYIGNLKNVYKKIITLYLQKEEVKASKYKESDFSLENYIGFMQGEAKGENFKKYKVFGYSICDLMKKNISELIVIFESFNNIKETLKQFCDNNLGKAYFTDKIGDYFVFASNLLNAKEN